MTDLFAADGDEFLVNTTIGGDQVFQDLIPLANGGFVVVWETQVGADVYGQIFDADGNKVGSEFRVNTVTTASQGLSGVGALSSGGFVVTWWDSSGQGGDTTASIKAQIFTPVGTKVGGEFLVNTATAGIQFEPVVTGLSSGNFVVAWRDSSGLGGDANGFAVKAQIFTSTGTKVGSEFLVNTTTVGNQSQPQISSLASGGFVIVWEDASQSGSDTDGSALKMQIFSAAGAKVGAELLVNTATGWDQFGANVITFASGGFVVTWTDASGTGGDSQSWSVKAQAFDASGSKVGAEFLVNTSTLSSQGFSDIAALPSGGFIVSWEDSSGTGGDASATSIKAQVYDADCNKVGTEFLVNTNSELYQTKPVVGVLTDGGFVISWTDQSGVGDPSGVGIKAQLFSPSDGPTDITLSNSTINEVSIDNLPVATITTSGPVGSDFTYQLISDSTGGAFDIQGDRLIVVQSGLLDFETTPSVTVTIRSVDIAGNAFDETVQVNITNGPEDYEFEAGSELVANMPTAGMQSHPALFSLSSGNIVVLWEDPSGDVDYDIKAQILGPDGMPLGNPFLINSTTIYDQTLPRGAALLSGGFVVVWQDFNDDVMEPAETGVRAQLFDANGEKVGTEFSVNSSIAGRQEQAVVSALPSGGFVVAWADFSTDGDIRAQLFDSAGNKVGGELSASSDAGANASPAISVLKSGNFIVTWYNASTESIRAQSFDSAGSKVGDEIAVNSDFSGTYAPHISALDNGGFVVVWSGQSIDDPDGGLFGQVFDPNGAKVGSTFHVNATTSGYQAEATVAALVSGGFIVSWVGSSGGADSNNFEIYSQMFDATGAKVGNEFLANSATIDLAEEFPALAPLPSGGFAVAWRGVDDPNSFGIRVRLVTPILGGSAGVDMLSGTSSADHLRGYAGNDALTGAAGNDRLDGGTGADVMSGGTDNDTYVVDNAGDTVTENADQGTDTVETGLGTGSTLAQRQAAQYQLSANVENLIGTGIGQGLRGNDLNNHITAGSGDDYVNASDGGTDHVDARYGRDVIYYGASLESSDANDAGEEGGDLRGDLLVIQGDYSAGVTLGEGALIDVEKFRILKGDNSSFGDTAGNSYSYDITTVDANVAAGARVVVQGGSLQLGEHLKFDGSAETDGSFQMFGGHDRDELIGGAQADHLLGRSGNDTLTGNGGDDRLRGGVGADTMDGGSGADTFVYASQGGAEPYSNPALESTGIGYDTIIGFNFASDKIDLPQTVTALASVGGGALSNASFDADLATAVDATLAVNGAILFTADSGDLSGKSFLVVDADGDGSYQADHDYVIQLVGAIGTVPTTPAFFV